MKKSYESFEQIDQDLRIYRLQQRVSAESIKFSLHRLQKETKPSNLIGGSALSTGKFLLGLATSRAVKKWLVRLVKK